MPGKQQYKTQFIERLELNSVPEEPMCSEPHYCEGQGKINHTLNQKVFSFLEFGTVQGL